MKMPQLDLDFTPENVQTNRKRLDKEIKELQTVSKMLEAMHGLNQSVCAHANKKDVYDPGYAGGGHDGYRCEDCGKRGYF